MAKTAAERQAAYRARRDDGEGERRLNAWISVGAMLALKRLARRDGITEKEMIQRLILAADDAVLKTLELDTAGWDGYFGVTA
jgi:hypothetical protein